MNTAIANGADWKLANTEVVSFNGFDKSQVFLHGHLIAEVGCGYIQLWDAGYQTATTKSRLNAILSENGLPGERVFQKDYSWFVRLSDGTTVPFFNGMRLN